MTTPIDLSEDLDIHDLSIEKVAKLYYEASKDTKVCKACQSELLIIENILRKSESLCLFHYRDAIETISIKSNKVLCPYTKTPLTFREIRQLHSLIKEDVTRIAIETILRNRHVRSWFSWVPSLSRQEQSNTIKELEKKLIDKMMREYGPDNTTNKEELKKIFQLFHESFESSTETSISSLLEEEKFLEARDQIKFLICKYLLDDSYEDKFVKTIIDFLRNVIKYEDFIEDYTEWKDFYTSPVINFPVDKISFVKDEDFVKKVTTIINFYEEVHPKVEEFRSVLIESMKRLSESDKKEDEEFENKMKNLEFLIKKETENKIVSQIEYEKEEGVKEEDKEIKNEIEKEVEDTDGTEETQGLLYRFTALFYGSQSCPCKNPKRRSEEDELSTESKCPCKKPKPKTEEIVPKESLVLKEKEVVDDVSDGHAAHDGKTFSLEDEKIETSESTAKETQDNLHHNQKPVKVPRKTIRELIEASRKD